MIIIINLRQTSLLNLRNILANNTFMTVREYLFAQIFVETQKLAVFNTRTENACVGMFKVRYKFS
jgi:hypothetical protein